jgi:hypothetical protein
MRVGYEFRDDDTRPRFFYFFSSCEHGGAVGIPFIMRLFGFVLPSGFRSEAWWNAQGFLSILCILIRALRIYIIYMSIYIHKESVVYMS